MKSDFSETVQAKSEDRVLYLKYWNKKINKYMFYYIKVYIIIYSICISIIKHTYYI